jgi:hypothetical protein
MANRENRYSSDFDDFFSFGIPEIEEIHVDEDEEAKAYALSIYERINKLRNAKAEEEAIASSQNSGSSISVVFSDDSAEDKDPDYIDIKDFLEVKVDGSVRVVPTFKTADKMREWEEVLHHHERRALDMIHRITQLPENKHFKQHVLGETQQRIGRTVLNVRDKHRKNLALLTIRIGAMEEVIKEKLTQIADSLKSANFSLDNVTDGVWVDPDEEEGDAKILSQLSTHRVVLQNRFKFDYRQTADLVNIMFSESPDVRAASKLNLSSKLSQTIYAEVIQYPGRTLDIVTAEARLTRDEILYLVFPKGERTNERKCLTCQTTVNINDVVYHKQCRTVKWLKQHCHFQYDSEDRCLTLPRQVYLTPTRRRLLVEVLKAHAMLKRDIIQRTPTETVIWTRHEDGSLHKVPVRKQREDEIVGSYAWRRKHGLVR